MPLNTPPFYKISIHALREEGDLHRKARCKKMLVFLSTPSARRATAAEPETETVTLISIHALREEGDGSPVCGILGVQNFYPRPPRGGRPVARSVVYSVCKISIHALREEGDRITVIQLYANISFLSTPSARRATTALRMPSITSLFLSTPSARRATNCRQHRRKGADISIHALREEGDPRNAVELPAIEYFYPRPPRGGRHHDISSAPDRKNFYPRPPRGGRRGDNDRHMDT